MTAPKIDHARIVLAILRAHGEGTLTNEMERVVLIGPPAQFHELSPAENEELGRLIEQVWRERAYPGKLVLPTLYEAKRPNRGALPVAPMPTTDMRRDTHEALEAMMTAARDVMAGRIPPPADCPACWQVKGGQLCSGEPACARRITSEEDCPGHVASRLDPKICGRCGVHIDSMRPEPCNLCDDPECDGDHPG